MNEEKKDIPNQKPENLSVPEADISYQVMPKLDGKKMPTPSESPFAQIKRKVEKPVENKEEEYHEMRVEEKIGFFHRRWVQISLIALGVLILVGIGYALFNRTPKEPPPTISTRLPKVWLMQYFGSEFCEDQTNCGDEADPDIDGLSNVDEFKEGTSPTNSDSDEDGLADGDEVNVYKTDAVLKYTDRRIIAAQEDYNDGHSLLNDYDPLTPGIRLTQIRKDQISSDANEFGLHTPTITTLNLQGSSPFQEQVSTISVFIEADQFLPETTFIKVGDIIVWLNKDSAQHKIKYNLSSELPDFESPVLGQDQTFSFTFDVAGSYNYFDELNPEIIGSIEVK